MYCTKCGKYIEDEEKGCPCSWAEGAQETLVRTGIDSIEKLETGMDSLGNIVQGIDSQEKLEAQMGSIGTIMTEMSENAMAGMNSMGKTMAEMDSTGKPLTGTWTVNVEKPFSNAAKVLIVAVTCLIPFIGLIFGFICAIIFLSSQKQDEKSFGKALLTLCIIFISISLLCCVFAYGFHVFDFLEGYLEGLA